MSGAAVGPEIVPLVGLAEQEGAEVAHGIGAAFSPAHASTFEALSDEPFAAGFDRSGTDLPAHGPVARIVHLVLMVVEILKLLTIDLAARRSPPSHFQLFPDGQQRRAAFVFELVAPSGCLLRRSLRVVTTGKEMARAGQAR